MDPAMRPEFIDSEKSLFNLGIPVIDVDQARAAMKDHPKVLAIFVPPFLVVHDSSSGGDGNVNAIYEVQYSDYSPTGKTFQIVETTENKTVYLKKSSSGISFQLTLEVGVDKSSKGKDMLVVRSTEMLIWEGTAATCCVLCFCCCCCLAPCVQSSERKSVIKEMKLRMNLIQTYVNNYDQIPIAKQIIDKESADVKV